MTSVRNNEKNIDGMVRNRRIPAGGCGCCLSTCYILRAELFCYSISDQTSTGEFCWTSRIKLGGMGWCLSTAASDSVGALGARVAYEDALIQSSKNDKAAALTTLRDTVIDHFALAASLASV